jgi:hypothetical protein
MTHAEQVHTRTHAGRDEEDIDALLAKMQLRSVEKTQISVCEQPSARW